MTFSSLVGNIEEAVFVTSDVLEAAAKLEVEVAALKLNLTEGFGSNNDFL